MDSLPAELLVNILRFLPGDELAHFKRLSKRFSEILAKNKKIIPNQRPSVSIALYSPEFDYDRTSENKNVHLRVSRKRKSCQLLLKDQVKVIEHKLKVPVTLLMQFKGEFLINAVVRCKAMVAPPKMGRYCPRLIFDLWDYHQRSQRR